MSVPLARVTGPAGPDASARSAEAGPAGHAVTSGHGILVGYDGSAGAEEAVAWAAREARERGLVLTVCLARALPYPAPPPASDGSGEPPGGEEALAPGLRLARELAGPKMVRPLLTEQPPAAALCGLCPAADMVVLGSRGRGGLPGLSVGSVSLQVAGHATGRIVVVRGHWQPVPGHAPRPVVVGIDGSAGSGAAARFGFEEAALRGTYLEAVCALADDPGKRGVTARIRAEVDSVISRLEQEYPGVGVHRHVTDGSARKALLGAAARAQMLIVGARGRGGFEGMSIGSVGLAVLDYARCPVGIVRPASDSTGDAG